MSTCWVGTDPWGEPGFRDGTMFTIAPAATIQQALNNGSFGVLVCFNSELFSDLTLPSEAMTRAELETAMKTALAALPTPLTLDDLQTAPTPTPVQGQAESDGVTGQSGVYSVTSATSWHWSASCTGAISGGGSATTESGASSALQGWLTANALSCKVFGFSVSTPKE